MNRFMRLVVIATALVASCAGLSSTAGAVTFTNSGATSFHATGGPSTLTIGGNNLSCTGASMTGTVGHLAFTAISLTTTYAPCSLIGIHTTEVCISSLTPVVFHSPGTITGTHDETCVVRLATPPFTLLCHSLSVKTISYFNPLAPSTPGRFTVGASSTVIVSNGSDASCSAAGVPTGTTRTGSATEQTFSVTSFAQSPLITSP